MTKSNPIEITGKIIEMLTPLDSEERRRIIKAALTLLGETASNHSAHDEDGEDMSSLPPRAKTWMKQNVISMDQLLQAFHIGDGKAEFISTIPGKDTKERALNAYLLAGLGKFLATGDPTFGDNTARELCKSSGCYDINNHAAYLKSKGNEFTGTKEKGWTLTSPGLKRAAELVAGLAK